MSSMGLTPLPPPRVPTHPKVTFKGARTWRESVAMFMLVGLSLAVFVSAICTAYYVYRNRETYEELVDYMDKTISISKINFNARIGEYKIHQKEHDVLGDQETYKTATLLMLFSECGCYVFIAVAVLLYMWADVSQGTKKILYWFMVAVTIVYAVIQIHVFAFFLYPYSSALPNQTETLLNHAIPYNPGGLQQMEQRFGCTFDLDLYEAYKRRNNPKNTCDPEIESSFYPPWLLITMGALRLVPIVIFVLLVVKRTPLSEWVAQLMESYRPGASSAKKRLYVKKQDYRNTGTYQTGDYGAKRTTFGATNSAHEADRPPVPSPGPLDHSISYNNAAYFATSGAYGSPSTRSSEISRIDAIDLTRAAHHNSGTIMSDV
ncbi:unnamed protein product, partial [Mesorhabditis spiculigera]